MQLDMHYFGTYAMARASGLKREACQTIATAAQFVDDAAEKEKLPFADGGRLDFIPTAHHTADYKNLKPDDQRLVWLPFHFIPGGEGETMSEKLVCQKDSQIAREMVEHNLSYADSPFGLYMAGITAHIYADTFSHYGFSGVGSRRNRVDYGSIRLLNLQPDMEQYVEEKKERFQAKYGEDIVENFRDLKDWAFSGIADAAALGHGGALTHPDRPYLKWQFDYEHPERKPSGLRDNPATFSEGCEKLHDMFRRFGQRHPKASSGDGRAFDDIRNAVERILATQAPCEQRCEAWQEAARNGELFASGEEILPYRGDQWKREIDTLRDAEDSKEALETSIFRFFQAAAIHRTYVLRDLLPKHGIVAD